MSEQNQSQETQNPTPKSYKMIIGAQPGLTKEQIREANQSARLMIAQNTKDNLWYMYVNNVKEERIPAHESPEDLAVAILSVYPNFLFMDPDFHDKVSDLVYGCYECGTNCVTATDAYFVMKDKEWEELVEVENQEKALCLSCADKKHKEKHGTIIPAMKFTLDAANFRNSKVSSRISASLQMNPGERDEDFNVFMQHYLESLAKVPTSVLNKEHWAEINMLKQEIKLYKDATAKKMEEIAAEEKPEPKVATRPLPNMQNPDEEMPF